MIFHLKNQCEKVRLSVSTWFAGSIDDRCSSGGWLGVRRKSTAIRRYVPRWSSHLLLPSFPSYRASVAALRRRPLIPHLKRTILVAWLLRSWNVTLSPPTAMVRCRVALHSMRRPRELCFLTTFPFLDTAPLLHRSPLFYIIWIYLAGRRMLSLRATVWPELCVTNWS